MSLFSEIDRKYNKHWKELNHLSLPAAEKEASYRKLIESINKHKRRQFKLTFPIVSYLLVTVIISTFALFLFNSVKDTVQDHAPNNAESINPIPPTNQLSLDKGVALNDEGGIDNTTEAPTSWDLYLDDYGQYMAQLSSIDLANYTRLIFSEDKRGTKYTELYYIYLNEFDIDIGDLDAVFYVNQQETEYLLMHQKADGKIALLVLGYTDGNFSITSRSTAYGDFFSYEGWSKKRFHPSIKHP